MELIFDHMLAGRGVLVTRKLIPRAKLRWADVDCQLIQFIFSIGSLWYIAVSKLYPDPHDLVYFT